MRAICQDKEHIHFGSESDARPSRAMILRDRHAALIIDRDLAEEIDVGHEVSDAHAMLGQLNEKVVPRIPEEIVAVLLIVALAKLLRRPSPR